MDIPYSGTFEYLDKADLPPLSHPTVIPSLYRQISSVYTILNDIYNLIQASKLLYCGEDRSRLRFLHATIKDIVTNISAASKDVTELPSFSELLKIVLTRMKDIHDILLEIRDRHLALKDNFDFFELKMRQYSEEIKTFFPQGVPVDNLPKPASLIEDPQARESWITYFGENRYCCSFSDLLSMLERDKIFNQAEAQFHVYLRYFLNFPDDEVVTPFRWNRMVRLFGPYLNFKENFMSTVTARGFLGLINRVTAYEMLTLHFKGKTLLIRMSRTEPNFMALSYRNSDGHIGHLINKSPDGQIVPLAQFIADKFPGYELIRRTVNVEKIFSLGSMMEYYSSSYVDYITDSVE